MAILGAASAYPRIYKKMTYTLSAATGKLEANIVTFPIFTAIITLNRGVVSSIAYDEGCFFCAENTPTCDFTALHANFSQPIYDPQLKGCRREQAECYPPAFDAGGLVGNGTSTAAANATFLAPNATDGAPVLNASSCDLRVYVVWTGTDSRNNGLMSANKRFSRYRQFNVATAYQSALNAANTGYDLAERTKATFEAIPGQIAGKNDQRRLGALQPGGGGGGGGGGGSSSGQSAAAEAEGAAGDAAAGAPR